MSQETEGNLKKSGVSPALWQGAAVLAAFALHLAHRLFSPASQTLFLAQALLHPESFASDPLAQASLAAPYSQGPLLLARAIGFLSPRLGLPAETLCSGLLALLCLGSAAMMFRLARAVTGRDDAAFLATLFFGLNMPLGPGEVPYGMSGLDRALGLVPLLWGISGIIQGRRWTALAGVGLATYLHANPAIHVWPWMMLEDAWQAWREPAKRRGAWIRLAAAFVIAFPLLRAVGVEPFPGGNSEPMRVSVLLLSNAIGGMALSSADVVFSLEGLALIGLALAAARARGLAGLPALARACGLALAMLALGRIACHAYTPDSMFWGAVVKYQPWVSLYLLELAGGLLLADGLAAQLRAGNRLWPAFLFTLTMSWNHDFVLRLLGIGLLAEMLRGRWKAGAALTFGGVLAPFVHAAFPEPWRVLATTLGLRGGLFALPAFAPASGALLLACLAGGFWLALRRQEGRSSAAALAVAALIMLSTVWRYPGAPSQDTDLLRMARWIRSHTEPRALIFAPLRHAPCGLEWMAVAQRPLFVSPEYRAAALLYGSSASGMAERLRQAGFSFSAVRGAEDYESEIARMDEAFTPEQAEALAMAHGVGYLLMPLQRRWPGRVLRQEGGFALYRALEKGP